MSKQPWECLCCGICCRDMYDEVGSFKFGTLLTLEEILFFPDEFVKPYVGVGSNGSSDGSPAMILQYQLDADVCPHLLEDNSCAIYSNRPLSCIGFPLDWHGGNTWFVSNKCKQAVDSVPYSPVDLVFPRYMYSAHILLSRLSCFDETSLRWLYNLNTQRWHATDEFFKAVDGDQDLKKFLEWRSDEGIHSNS